MATTEGLIDERTTTHGQFGKASERWFRIAQAVGPMENLNPAQTRAMVMIVEKMTRILEGDPNVKDHWRDIAGYATLIANDV